MKKYIAILFVALIAFACAGKQEVKAPVEAVEVTAAEEVAVDTTVAVPVDTTVAAPVQ